MGVSPVPRQEPQEQDRSDWPHQYRHDGEGGSDFPDADDVLLFNEHGAVTESCIANVVINLDGRKVTPPFDFTPYSESRPVEDIVL